MMSTVPATVGWVMIVIMLTTIILAIIFLEE